MDLYTFLILSHLVGTVLAVGGATMIEVHLNKALADGDMTGDERGMLGLNFTVLRTGLVISVLTGVGFIAFYYTNNQFFRLENPIFWAKMTMLLIVLINAVLLQAHKISLYWGSALSFVGWWGIMFAGFFLNHAFQFSFIEMMGGFLVTVVAGAFILHKIREHIKNSYQNHA